MRKTGSGTLCDFPSGSDKTTLKSSDSYLVLYPLFQSGLVWVGDTGDSGRNKSSSLAIGGWDLRGQRKEEKEIRRNTEEGICWQMWELVGRFIQVPNLCRDMGNQVRKGPEKSSGCDVVCDEALLWFQENQSNNESRALRLWQWDKVEVEGSRNE